MPKPMSQKITDGIVNAECQERARESHADPGALLRNINEVQASCDATAARVLSWCERYGVRIATAESLTGGLLADSFVRIPGASAVFLGSAVTYDIKAKASVLGVDAELLKSQGAVHPEVARSMALGCAQLYAQPEYGNSVIGISTTGVAGPGPDGDKPAGLVYVGLHIPRRFSGVGMDVNEAFVLHLQGSREMVRALTVWHALQNVSYFTVGNQE